ncbi:MAG: lysyl-tRNA synthetase, class, partial [Frankiaceae bacterium]|nr:lysyl-tRNA synthetase, class [Frankiaceae bacterium]
MTDRTAPPDSQSPRDERPRDEKSRDERPRGDKPRDERPREEADVETTRADRRTRRTWIPRAAAWIIGLSGVLNITSTFAPRLYHHVRAVAEAFPAEVTGAATGATVFSGVLLLLLTRGLRRRKQRAHRLAVAVLAITAVLHIARGLDVGESIVCLVLLVALLVYRAEFYAASDPRTRWGALAWFLTAAPIAVGFSLAVLMWRARTIVTPHPFSAELEHVLLGLIGVTGPLEFTSQRMDNAFGTALFVLGALIGISTIYLVLRPAEPLASLDAEDERRLRELLAKHGAGDSLGYFALRRDKAVIWSPTGKSAITYRVISGVMLASGDPLGDSEAWPGAIKQFIQEAERHAWVPAVIGCSERAAEVWSREADLDALEFGDEAVLDVANFSLDGRPMRNVRQMVNRVERADFTAAVCKVRDIAPERIKELSAQASSWASTETERGFSMALGRLGDPADADCLMVEALFPAERADPGPVGDVAGLLSFVPWGSDGFSLDVMR